MCGLAALSILGAVGLFSSNPVVAGAKGFVKTSSGGRTYKPEELKSKKPRKEAKAKLRELLGSKERPHERAELVKLGSGVGYKTVEFPSAKRAELVKREPLRTYEDVELATSEWLRKQETPLKSAEYEDVGRRPTVAQRAYEAIERTASRPLFPQKPQVFQKTSTKLAKEKPRDVALEGPSEGSGGLRRSVSGPLETAEAPVSPRAKGPVEMEALPKEGAPPKTVAKQSRAKEHWARLARRRRRSAAKLNLREGIERAFIDFYKATWKKKHPEAIAANPKEAVKRIGSQLAKESSRRDLESKEQIGRDFDTTVWLEFKKAYPKSAENYRLIMEAEQKTAAKGRSSMASLLSEARTKRAELRRGAEGKKMELEVLEELIPQLESGVLESRQNLQARRGSLTRAEKEYEAKKSTEAYKWLQEQKKTDLEALQRIRAERPQEAADFEKLLQSAERQYAHVTSPVDAAGAKIVKEGRKLLKAKEELETSKRELEAFEAQRSSALRDLAKIEAELAAKPVEK